MRVRLLPALLLFVSVASPRPTARADDTAAPPPPLDTAAALAVREAMVVRRARSVVLARVKQVHESPGIWCGGVVTWQDVDWTIDRVIDGEDPGPEVVLGHLLVAKSPLVDTEARLDPKKIFVGQRALLFLEAGEEPGHVGTGGHPWAVHDEAYSVRLVPKGDR